MVKLVLTAFGKFHGVANNPTKDILQQIQSVRNFQNSVYKDIIYTALVEVSAEGASEHLRRIRKSIQNKYPTEKIVFIHMGVHGKASMIHLESTAWNLMDFRVPDERNQQPRKELIVTDNNLKFLETKINIEKLLNFDGLKGKAKRSTDPGRFVCNFIFFCSLHLNHTKVNETSIFVHVSRFSAYASNQRLTA